ncbi:MAG TPA: DNA replication/repair protein RecF [Luteibaculaceae bacterium]|nr:DNA replication/repair protein RecF [Luteibaculaceae bacterium]
MFLSKLSLIGFKNYESLEIEFNAKVTGLYGNNGQGKTNLLDAIYYLCFGKSFLQQNDTQHIRFGSEFFLVQGDFVAQAEVPKTHQISIGVKKGAPKAIKCNAKEYERIAEHIGLIPLVMISPTDTELVGEGSELRRKFMDGIISQYDRPYLLALQSYNRTLKQRNALLKHFHTARFFDPSMLEVYNEQLSETGEVIHKTRLSFLEFFVPLFKSYYAEISGGSEQPELIYQSTLNATNWSDGFLKSTEKDRQVQFTTFGIHKDDLAFELDQHPLKKFGSQGQRKSYVLALKMAQYTLIADRSKKPPILLLDDIFDKLDENRLTHLLGLIEKMDAGQVFITDTEYDRLNRVLGKMHWTYTLLQVTDGALTA